MLILRQRLKIIQRNFLIRQLFPDQLRANQRSVWIDQLHFQFTFYSRKSLVTIPVCIHCIDVRLCKQQADFRIMTEHWFTQIVTTLCIRKRSFIIDVMFQVCQLKFSCTILSFQFFIAFALLLEMPDWPGSFESENMRFLRAS
ncbi:hypothetical protein D3C85_1161470 [compost metagenome]